MRKLLFGLGTLFVATACSSSNDTTSASGSSSGCTDAPEGTRALATEAIVAERCTFPSTISLKGRAEGRLTSASGKTLLYLVVQEKNGGPVVFHRFVLRDGACAFDVDPSFVAPSPAPSNFAVDDTGTFYSGSTTGIVRVRGEESVECTASSSEGNFFVSPSRFAVARDGSFGILNVGNVRSVAKLTNTDIACDIGRIELSQPLLQPDVVAIDTKKRFHISALAVGEDDLSPRIAIVDANGKVACAYHSTRSAADRNHEAIVPCAGGMCIDGGDEVVKVTDDGAFVRAVRVDSPLASGATLVGASEAPYPLLVGKIGSTEEAGVFAVRGL